MRTLSPVRVAIFAIVVLGFLGGMGYLAMQAFSKPTENSSAPVVQQSQPQTLPKIQPTKQAQQPQKPQPQPTEPALVASSQPEQPAQIVGDQIYPVLDCDGSKPQLDVAFDSYAGFYPLVYRIMAMPASDYYCINLLPKWSGDPRFDLSEADIEKMLRDGDVDVYFGSNGALALYDAKSGFVVWTTDQSAKADSIIARNSISAINKPNFNDILGRTIITSKGSADHFFSLKMMQTTGFTPDMVTFIFSDSPVKEFLAGIGDIVAYWDPVIRDAMLPENTELASTGYWRTISDYVIISPEADSNMQDAVKFFLIDYNNATDAFTKEKVAETANLLVNFRFNGQDMADWMFLDKDDPYGSLNGLLDGVAIAKLNDVVTMFDTDPTGSSPVKEQFKKTHVTWMFGQVNDNGNEGSVFNSDISITDKYVKLVLEDGAKQVEGEFNNEYDTDVSKTPPPVDANTLFQLPEMLSLSTKDIKFEEGYSNLLQKGQKEKLINLIRPIANMMDESDNTVIIIRGGAGYFPTTPAELIQQKQFAYARSTFLRKILSSELKIPIQRIVCDPNVLIPDHELSEAELPGYIAAVIKVKNVGNFK